MAKEIFAGRRNYTRDFSRYLSAMAAEGKDQRSFLSFRKQTDEEELWPRIFMFYGATGTGKSAMVDHCLDLARSMGSETKKPIKALLLDGEDISLRTTVTIQSIIEAMYAVFIENDSAMATYLTEYSQLRQRLEHIQEKTRRLMMQEWYLEIVRREAHSHEVKKQEASAEHGDIQANAPALDFRSWLHENNRLTEDELDLYDNSDYRLSKALVNGVVQLSTEYPVVLAIDTYERIGVTEIEDWLRTIFLGKLFERKNKVMVIISGRENLTRNYRNSFREEMLYTVSFNDILLSRSDIYDCAQTCQVKLAQEEINNLEEISKGVPLVVRDVLGLVKNNASLADVLKETPKTEGPIDQLVLAETRRFLKQCPDNTLKKKIVQWSLMYHCEANVLAKLWNVSYAGVSAQLNELSEQYPFVFCKRVHGTGNRVLRDLLIKEAAAGKNDEISSMTKEFGAAAAQLFSERLDELSTAITVIEKRYVDNRYQISLLAFCTSLVWDDSGRLFNNLPGILLECLQYNQTLALRLLQRIDEFRPLLSKNQCKSLDIMKDGVLAFDPQGIWLMAAPGEKETDFLKLLEEKSADGAELRRALLYCRKGELYFRSGQYDRACEEFERCLPFVKVSVDFGRTVIDSLNAAGAFFSASHNFEAALRVYKPVVESRPDDPEAWYAFGRAQTEKGMHAEAAVSYAKAVELKPDLHDSWLGLGREYFALGSFDLSVQAFEKALGEKPREAGDWHKAGKSYRELGQNEKAVEALKKACELEDGNKDFWYDCAAAYAALGRDDDAAGSYEKTVRIDPACYDAWSGLGKLHYQHGRYDASIEAYTKVLEKVPDNKDALYTIALAQYERGAYIEAISYLGKFLEFEPVNRGALYTMALSLHARRQYSDAIQYYKKVTDARPENIDAWYNMGRVYRAQGLHQDAVDAFRKALAIDTEKPELWDDLGLVFSAMNLWGDAIQCFKNLVKLDPSWAQAWYHLGMTYHQVRHFDDAVKSFMTAVEADPGHDRAWGSLGLTYYSMENYEKAIEAYSKALSLKPDEVWILCNLALAYVSAGKFDQAAIEYDKIISRVKSKDDLLLPISGLTEAIDRNPGLEGAKVILQKLHDAEKQKEGS